MKNLPNLFKLIELTRSQVQYGYLLSGIKRNDLSNLAEHHYLVTFIGWQLALHLKQAGAKIDVQKVLEFCLIHDLGELMGGDISALYAKANPKAKKLAVAFEEENQKYLAKFFGDNSEHFEKLASEILDAKSDEALIAKVADYTEALNYKVYVGAFLESDRKFNVEKMKKFVEPIKDKVVKKLLTQFIADQLKSVDKNNYIEILNG
jgi:5'-deoxynucleotidase YfbR-like HD superfamily hydrolase